MKSRKKIKKWLLKNCVNKYGDLDLSKLDFSDFDGDVDIGDMEVKNNLFQSDQKVGGSLNQCRQKVSDHLLQNLQTVRGTLMQNYQEVGEDLFQDNQKVRRKIAVGWNTTEEICRFNKTLRRYEIVQNMGQWFYKRKEK